MNLISIIAYWKFLQFHFLLKLILDCVPQMIALFKMMSGYLALMLLMNDTVWERLGVRGSGFGVRGSGFGAWGLGLRGLYVPHSYINWKLYSYYRENPLQIRFNCKNVGNTASFAQIE